MHSRAINPNGQSGAALVVCLIVLLVMSVIGVTSVSNSTVQQRMAFNLRQQQLAENAAEHALRAAERFIATTIVTTQSVDNFYNDPNRGSSYFMVADIRGKPYQESDPGDLLDPSYWGANGIEVPGLSADVTAQAPRYIVELIGKTKEGRGRSVNNPSAREFDNFRYNFRITAIGWGVDTNAYAVLQSTYESERISDF